MLNANNLRKGEKMGQELKYLTDTEKRAVEELSSILRKTYGKEIKEIRLFGSKARGDFEKYSDIDIFVVFDREVDWKFEEEIDVLLYQIEIKYGVFFNLILYSSEQLKDSKIQALPLINNIRKEGIAI